MDMADSYRPIALLSPVAKLIETLLLLSLKESLPVANHQHDFRSGRSTTTCLDSIYHLIATGLNQPKPAHRTILVALDLSKSFDTVRHDLLLDIIISSLLAPSIKRWLGVYLRNRQAIPEFRGVRSKYRHIKMGVPQGGVLSPTLFNSYMARLPQPPSGITLFSYADDCIVLSTGPPPLHSIVNNLNSYLEVLNAWFGAESLQLNPEKSSATLFTSYSKELNTQLPISIQGGPVPTIRQPKLLGVTFDNLLNFSHHAAQIKTKVRKRNNILKALVGTTWGASKEVMLTAYSFQLRCARLDTGSF